MTERKEKDREGGDGPSGALTRQTARPWLTTAEVPLFGWDYWRPSLAKGPTPPIPSPSPLKGPA